MEKYTHPVTPIINERVIEFCKELSQESPFYVNVEIDTDAEVNECFINVQKYVQKHGGEMVIGWAIWELPTQYIEAEFHAIWKCGEVLKDITPKGEISSKVLFLPDSQKNYEGIQINNHRKLMQNNPLWVDFFELTDKRFNLLNKDGKEKEYGLVTLTGKDAQEYSDIENRRAYISVQLRSYLPNFSPYLPCPNGCGKKAKWCECDTIE